VGPRLTSRVTRAELFAGSAATDLVSTLLSVFREIPVNREVAERAARIRREAGIRLPDALIAATALEHRLGLATRNRADFERVRGLRPLRPAGRECPTVSFSVDANVLLYASDTSSPRHETARRILSNQTGKPEILYLAWPVAMAYLRIATHPRIFDAPLTPAVALSNLRGLLALPRVRPIGEKDSFLETYSTVTGELTIRGNLVPDAHLATILFQHGIRTLYTNDADFRKFDFLDVRNPFGEGARSTKRSMVSA
jgi:toxin-antitoxin system PIN domain toxin